MNDIVLLISDAILIGLLITAIFFAVRLSKQLSVLKDAQKELQRFVADFSLTITRAESGIRDMKQVARNYGDDLESLIDKSRDMRDELSLLIESADHIATRLSETTPAQRPVAREENTAQAQPASATPLRNATTAERDLLAALGKTK